MSKATDETDLFAAQRIQQWVPIGVGVFILLVGISICWCCRSNKASAKTATTNHEFYAGFPGFEAGGQEDTAAWHYDVAPSNVHEQDEPQYLQMNKELSPTKEHNRPASSFTPSAAADGEGTKSVQNTPDGMRELHSALHDVDDRLAELRQAESAIQQAVVTWGKPNSKPVAATSFVGIVVGNDDDPESMV
jgi:hypothetical protein